MDFIIGFLVGMGLVLGIDQIRKENKKYGIIEIVLSILFPIVLTIFSLNKDNYAFDGDNFEFLIQCITVEKMILPWLILILFIAWIIFSVFLINKIQKRG